MVDRIGGRQDRPDFNGYTRSGVDRRKSLRRREDNYSHIAAKIALVILGFIIAKFFTL